MFSPSRTSVFVVCLVLSFGLLPGTLRVTYGQTQTGTTAAAANPSAIYEEARVLSARGDYAAAQAAFERMRQAALQSGDKVNVAVALRGLGNVQYALGNFAPAQDYYQRSLKLAEEIQDQASIQNAANNLGNIFYQQGDYAKALAHYQRGQQLAEQRHDPAGLANAYHNLGTIYLFQARHALALETQTRALQLARETGNALQTGELLNNIGLTRLAMNESAAAQHEFEQALQLAREKGFKPLALRSLHNLALVHEAQAQYALAESFYQQALPLAETLGDKEALTSLWSNLGNARRLQGDYRQAIELTERALRLAQQIGNLELLSKASYRAGKAYTALNQPAQAEQAFAAAIRTAEQLRYQAGGSAEDRQRFLEARIRPYYGMIELLAAQCRAAEALEYAQRAKGRVLMDVLQSGKADFAKAMTPAEAEQERRQTRTLTALNTALYRERLQAQPDEKRVAEFESQLQRVRLEQEAFQAGLYAAHPELKLQRGELQPLSLAEIAALLPDAHTALLEYIVAEQQTYLFVITRGTGAQPVNLQLYSLSLTGREASELPERLRRRIAHRYFDFRELGAELSQRLLTPARAQLRDKHALVIIPDGGLWQLPFQALPALSASSASGTANSRYLIEDYAISYAPSLPVLQAMMRQRAARQQPTPRQPHAGTSLLAFGDPTLGTQAVARAEALLMGDRLTPLPETARQVRALKQVYGAAHSKVLLGAAAREDVLKTEAGRYRILHLATHGILNDVNPLYSQLLLSQPETGATETADGGEDGLLEAWEIMRLNLQADLVVLSACETARGRVGSGEGIIGLTWAFFIAGSPANVVSQWKVESRSTAELMLAFHRRLQSGTTPASAAPGLATAEALRQAALTLLHKPEYRHPFYWAGFVLVGAGR